MDSVILEITTHELDKLLEMYPECLLRLPPREREVIEMRNSGFTLEEIGKHYDVTRERVRQISIKAFRRIQRYVGYHLLGKYDTEIRELRDEIAELQTEKQEITDRLVKEYLEKQETEESKLLKTSIDDLELSVRSYNCLKNTGVRTLGALVEKSEQDLKRTRNFGAKSLSEIKCKLKELGLHLRREDEE